MRALALAVLLALALPAAASRDRVHALATELRCPVCQNQNLADSNADMAVDLRREIARQVEAGRSDAEIRRFMVERYGQFVLYEPALSRHTLLLWSAPALLLLGVGLFLWRRQRRGRAEGVAP
jgi:cytochrome c-type biogenesis protein CcmH